MVKPEEKSRTCYLHFEVVNSIVVLGEERQCPDAGEKERDAGLFIP